MVISWITDLYGLAKMGSTPAAGLIMKIRGQVL